MAGVNPETKIKTLDELAELVGDWHAQNLKVTHCHGVFDLLHPGHLKHLDAARAQGDRLVVTLTPDHFVNKGPGRPVFNAQMRAYALASIEAVDCVAVNEWKTAVETIKKLKPDIYVKGSDYAPGEHDITEMISEEVRAIESLGGRIHITDEITFSSSTLINNHFGIYPSETEAWLGEFRKKYAEDDIFDSLSGLGNLDVLVLGEVIIDEYVFCEGLGKSSKDPILAFHDRGTEKYAGGSIAVANHLAGICRKVSLLSVVGDRDNDIEFINGAMNKSVEAHLIERQGTPTIHKRRFVDTHTKAKLMEIYEMAEDALPEAVEIELLDQISQLVSQFDVVIVTDYGHGMMTPKVIERVAAEAKFLAVNTQHNAGNRGYNTIARYPRADYLCMNGNELAIETRRRDLPPRDQISGLLEMISCDDVTVTLGEAGSLHFNAKTGFATAPALAVQVLDRVGSGDAVLALTAPLVHNKVPIEIVSFIANVVGAEVVGVLGSSSRLDGGGLRNHIRSLLK